MAKQETRTPALERTGVKKMFVFKTSVVAHVKMNGTLFPLECHELSHHDITNK
jgi:hypothetical protein